MSTDPGSRLKEERLRLGLTQEQFGALGGVKKQAQLKYEKGERKPDAAYFEGIAAAGANVDYILTGTPAALREKLNDIKISSEMARILSGDKEEFGNYQNALFEALGRARAAKADEEDLLESYRRCEPEDKKQISSLAKRLAPPVSKS